MNKAQITRRADEDEVGSKTVERDYVLAHLVGAIAQERFEFRLVFKGGTALRLCHFDDHRYSADLDFSIMGATVADAQSVISGDSGIRSMTGATRSS